MMKILQVGKYYYPYYGGMETHLYNLCNELRTSVEVRVVVSNTSWRTVSETVNGVPVVRVGRLMNIRSTDVSPLLYRYLKKYPCDIMHVHMPNPAAELAALRTRGARKLVLTYQSDVIRQKLLMRLYRPALQSVLRSADMILVHSRAYADSSPHLAEFAHKVRIVPLGIDTSLYEKTPEIEKRVAEIHREYGGDIVVFTGRLVYYKGIEYLIDAMRDVNAYLVIIGNGPLKNELELRVKERGLTGKVSLLQDVPDDEKAAFLHAARVFCLPSTHRSEAFGIAQIEAMACGTPVVNTNIPGSGVTEVSVHNETGLTVTPGDAGALAEGLNRIIADSGLRTRFGENARKRVKEQFTKEKTAEAVLGVYKEITGTG